MARRPQRLRVVEDFVPHGRAGHCSPNEDEYEVTEEVVERRYRSSRKRVAAMHQPFADEPNDGRSTGRQLSVPHSKLSRAAASSAQLPQVEEVEEETDTQSSDQLTSTVETTRARDDRSCVRCCGRAVMSLRARSGVRRGSPPSRQRRRRLPRDARWSTRRWKTMRWSSIPCPRTWRR